MKIIFLFVFVVTEMYAKGIGLILTEIQLKAVSRPKSKTKPRSRSDSATENMSHFGIQTVSCCLDSKMKR